eukprot:768476-Hanusia_phi.AAC.9
MALYEARLMMANSLQVNMSQPRAATLLPLDVILRQISQTTPASQTQAFTPLASSAAPSFQQVLQPASISTQAAAPKPHIAESITAVEKPANKASQECSPSPTGSANSKTALVCPRKKRESSWKHDSNSDEPVALTKELLESHFNSPLALVSKKLGICPTAIKRACRKLGISKWPYKSPNPGPKKKKGLVSNEAKVPSNCDMIQSANKAIEDIHNWSKLQEQLDTKMSPARVHDFASTGNMALSNIYTHLLASLARFVPTDGHGGGYRVRSGTYRTWSRAQKHSPNIAGMTSERRVLPCASVCVGEAVGGHICQHVAGLRMQQSESRDKDTTTRTKRCRNGILDATTCRCGIRFLRQEKLPWSQAGKQTEGLDQRDPVSWKEGKDTGGSKEGQGSAGGQQQRQRQADLDRLYMSSKEERDRDRSLRAAYRC